jgi:KDO2-lipid IV(A) lauroyltransferase
MAITLQNIINSRFGVGFALSVGPRLPPRIGYALAPFLADRIASRRKSTLVRSVRANQWVVAGENCTAEELDQAVRATIRQSARNIYELYSNLNNRRALRSVVEISPPLRERIESYRSKNSGMVIVTPHLSNFDLIGRAVDASGFRALVISFPQPGGGYRWQNRMRKEVGVELIPASKTALRKSLEHLKAGGLVFTGMDRPIPDSKYRPHFFGRPAAMPVFHVLLALRANVPIVVWAPIQGPDGVYRIEASEEIEMTRHPDRKVEITQNAEACLEVAADYIRRVPHQWMMFYPVWPEAIEEVVSRYGY